MLFATENHHDNYALPAEWAPQSAVQLTWPHENSDWNYCLDAITQTFVELVRAIVPFEPVLIVTPNVEQTRARLVDGFEVRTSCEQRHLGARSCPDNAAREKWKSLPELLLQRMG